MGLIYMNLGTQCNPEFVIGPSLTRVGRTIKSLVIKGRTIKGRTIKGRTIKSQTSNSLAI
jgi:hypothetical protein